MYNFLLNNRDELIARCVAKVAARKKRAASAEQMETGIPMFLDQLIRTLKAEDAGENQESVRISGASGGAGITLSEMGVTATAHGKELLRLGFSVDQVVHDYGDLCQAITDLAFERDAPFAIDEFRTLNRCLDNAIADAVTEFSSQRDASMELRRSAEANERIGLLVHELNNALGSASLAFSALEAGSLSLSGATGGVLKRSLAGMGALISQSMHEIRLTSWWTESARVFSVAEFIADAKLAADLKAASTGCRLEVSSVDPLLGIQGNYDLLLGALANLLNNAFKFTHKHTLVTLTAHASAGRVLIDVADHCGGLPPGDVEKMFKPFFQRSRDRTGVGLGLSIARRSVEADGGKLSVRDVPGVGCVFTIDLPQQKLR